MRSEGRVVRRVSYLVSCEYLRAHQTCSPSLHIVQGCKRKFDIDKYVARIGAMVKDVKAAAAAAAKQ